MSLGKLYRFDNKQMVSEVNYHGHIASPTSWWGELTTVSYIQLNENDWYVIELEDERCGKVRLKKRVNGPVSGVPPRYIYHFTGTTELE